MVTPIVVSYSELDSFRQCPHKFDLAYRQRWEADRVGVARGRGIVWHELMAIHYRAIQADSTDEARRVAISKHLLELAEFNPDDADLLAWMYDGYEELYGIDPQWEIVAIEDQALARLPTTTGRASRFWLRMRIDLIVRERLGVPGGWGKTKLWIVDHKTGQNLPTERELDVDDQFGLYTWGRHRLGDPVFGSIYSAARTQRNKTVPQPLDERFSRTHLYRTDRELETIAREAYQTARTAFAYESGRAPRAPDSDRCRWRCDYTEPCLLGRKAGPAAEQQFLATGGYTRMTEDQQLAKRGYPDPLGVPGPRATQTDATGP